MSGLVEALAAQAQALGQRAIAEMYQNPFWLARFGPRGRELADKDGDFHVAYLIGALEASDPSVFERYARWLQTLLVSRGMCSRHIDENFQRLERAIAELVPDSGAACDVLRAGRRSLIYDAGVARELQLLADPLAEKVLDALSGRQPGWFAAASSYVSLASFESLTHAERVRWKSDVLDHLSYLADALQAERPELFAEHAVWAHDFFTHRHGPSARLVETLYALTECLPPSPGSGGAPDRTSLRPVSLRPPLSEPPPPPVPLLMSAELAEGARGLIERALEQVAQGAREPAATPKDAEGASQ